MFVSSLNLALISFAVAVIAAGQIAMKVAAQKLVIESGQTVLGFVRDNTAALVIVGGAMSLYALAMAAWILALRTTPLSVAYLFNALAFVLVPALAWVLFGEALPRFFVPALVLILVSIGLLSLG